jgi:uncharacterized iron-regulated membrane protein
MDGTGPVRIAAAGAPAARRPGRARLWFLVHSWLGFKLSLVMGVICLSGSLAAVSHEIDWLLTPSLRAPFVPDGTLDWAAAEAALRAAYPDGRLSSLRVPEGPGFAATAFVALPDGTQRIAHLDPATGGFQGDTARLTAQRVLRDLHMWLFITNSWGLVIVSAFSLPLLASVVTGLVVYKRFWRGFFRLRLGAGPRVLVGDLHKLVGLWSVPFVLLIGVTGVWYLVEIIGLMNGHRFDRPAPGVPRTELPGLGPAPRPIGAAEAVGRAQAAYPGLRPVAVIMPRSVTAPVIVWGQAEAWLVRERANAVRLHPVTGAVLDVQRGDELRLMERVVDTADPLHFGNFGGLPTKLLYLAFGLALTGLVVTGGWLTLRRGVRLWRDAAPRGGAAEAPRRLGRWRWANIALLGTAAGLAPVVLLSWEGRRDIAALGQRSLGPYEVSLLLQRGGQAASRGLHLRVDCGGCLPNPRAATLFLPGRAAAPTPLATTLGGTPLAGPLSGPVRLQVETWAGERFDVTWNVP